MSKQEIHPVQSTSATSAIYQPSFKTEEMRMRLKKILPVTCVLLALSVPSWAQNTKYDFDYRTTDQRVQVFDDGKVTRIQLPEGTPDPTIVAIEPRGEVLLKVSKEAPHLVVPGIYSRIVMRWGNRREVQAVYNGASAPTPYTERTGAGASFGSVTPEARFGAVAKPVEVQLAKAAPTMPALDVPRSRAAVPEQASLPAAVTAVAATVPVAAPAAAPAVQGPTLKRFAFQASDKTVDGAFSRWAEESKLGKKVVWRVARKLPLDALGDFEAENAVVAMSMVAASFDNSRNPIVVEEYDNAFVVVPRIAARLEAK